MASNGRYASGHVCFIKKYMTHENHRTNAALTYLDQAIQCLQQEILTLKQQGTRAGAIESYPRGKRTYYNYAYYEEGKPIRRYLPLKQKAEAEAEIQRGRQVEQLEAAIALLEQASEAIRFP